MATLRIYDSNGLALAVDLRHLIDVLAPRSLQATWTVSPVTFHYPAHHLIEKEFMATGQDSDRLEELARNGSSVSGAVMAELAQATRQVIWGEFAASLPQQEVAWVTIRAIDSSFYEVTTTDDAVLDKVKSTYKDVRVAAGPANSAPIPQIPRKGG
jgi:hypothetical protein